MNTTLTLVAGVGFSPAACALIRESRFNTLRVDPPELAAFEAGEPDGAVGRLEAKSGDAARNEFNFFVHLAVAQIPVIVGQNPFSTLFQSSRAKYSALALVAGVGFSPAACAIVLVGRFDTLRVDPPELAAFEAGEPDGAVGRLEAKSGEAARNEFC